MKENKNEKKNKETIILALKTLDCSISDSTQVEDANRLGRYHRMSEQSQ